MSMDDQLEHLILKNPAEYKKRLLDLLAKHQQNQSGKINSENNVATKLINAINRHDTSSSLLIISNYMVTHYKLLKAYWNEFFPADITANSHILHTPFWYQKNDKIWSLQDFFQHCLTKTARQDYMATYNTNPTDKQLTEYCQRNFEPFQSRLRATLKTNPDAAMPKFVNSGAKRKHL